MHLAWTILIESTDSFLKFSRFLIICFHFLHRNRGRNIDEPLKHLLISLLNISMRCNSLLKIECWFRLHVQLRLNLMIERMIILKTGYLSTIIKLLLKIHFACWQGRWVQFRVNRITNFNSWQTNEHLRVCHVQISHLRLSPLLICFQNPLLNFVKFWGFPFLMVDLSVFQVIDLRETRCCFLNNFLVPMIRLEGTNWVIAL